MLEIFDFNNSWIWINRNDLFHWNIFNYQYWIKNFHFLNDDERQVILWAKVFNLEQIFFWLIFENFNRLLNRRASKKFSNFWVVLLTSRANFYQHIFLCNSLLFRKRIITQTQRSNLSCALRNALSLQTTFHDIFARHSSYQYYFDFSQISSIITSTLNFIAINLFAAYSFDSIWAVSRHIIWFIANVTTHETRLLIIKFLIIDRTDMNMRDRKNNLNRRRKKREKDIKFDKINSRLIFSFDNAKNLIFTQIMNEIDFQIFHCFRETLDN